MTETLDYWISRLMNKTGNDRITQIVDEVYQDYLTHQDYGQGLVQCCALSTTNQQIGDICQLFACRVFGWTDVHANSNYSGCDCLLQDGTALEVKSSCPPRSGFRVGQLQDRSPDDQAQLLFQFYDVHNCELFFFWFDSIRSFIDEFNPPSDQGKNTTVVGYRSINHRHKQWPQLLHHRISFDQLAQKGRIHALEA